MAADRDDGALGPWGGAAEGATIEGMSRPVPSAQMASIPTRRRAPWLLVEVDGSTEGHHALVWALREAARREATVVAVSVLDEPGGDPLTGTARVPLHTREAALDRLEALVLRAVAETGVRGRTRTAVLERPVFEALDAAVHGADLVLVGSGGKRLLRPALPRPPLRRIARGA
jgi:nucleotide-binding universal stress UspA family protein